jgi:hypothetical protein
MPFHIRDPETDPLARALAHLRGEGITGAVKSALKAKLAAERAQGSLDGANQGHH